MTTEKGARPAGSPGSAGQNSGRIPARRLAFRIVPKQSGSGQIRWTDFAGEWIHHTPAGEYREDRTRTLSASVYHRRFTIYGFSPEVAVTHEVRDTNAQLYDYKRTSGELRFVRQF